MVGTTVSTGIAMSSETLKPLVWFGVFVAPVRVSTRLNVTMAGMPDGAGPTWRLVPVICSAPAVLRELKAMADPELAPRMVPTTVPWGAPTWNAAALKVSGGSAPATIVQPFACRIMASNRGTSIGTPGGVVYCLPSNEIVNPAGGSIVMVFLPAIVAYVVHPLAFKTPRSKSGTGIETPGMLE